MSKIQISKSLILNVVLGIALLFVGAGLMSKSSELSSLQFDYEALKKANQSDQQVPVNDPYGWLKSRLYVLGAEPIVHEEDEQLSLLTAGDFLVGDNPVFLDNQTGSFKVVPARSGQDRIELIIYSSATDAQSPFMSVRVCGANYGCILKGGEVNLGSLSD